MAVMQYGECENKSAGDRVVPKLPVERSKENEDGPLDPVKSEVWDEEEQEDRQPKKPMEQARKDDYKAPVGGASSLVFNFLDEDENYSVAVTIEPTEDEIFTLDPHSAFMKKVWQRAALLTKSHDNEAFDRLFS